MRSPALIAYAVGGSDLRSKLYSLRAREDAHTILERGRERWRLVENEQASSGVPAETAAASDDDIGPYGAGCRAVTADLRWVDCSTKF